MEQMGEHLHRLMKRMSEAIPIEILAGRRGGRSQPIHLPLIDNFIHHPQKIHVTTRLGLRALFEFKLQIEIMNDACLLPRSSKMFNHPFDISWRCSISKISIPPSCSLTEYRAAPKCCGKSHRSSFQLIIEIVWVFLIKITLFVKRPHPAPDPPPKCSECDAFYSSKIKFILCTWIPLVIAQNKFH